MQGLHLVIYKDVQRRPASKGPCFQKFRLMFMRASFQIRRWTIARRQKIKKPFIHIRDEELSPRYHPNYVPTCKRHFGCCNGHSRRGLLDSPAQFLLRDNRRVRSFVPFRGFCAPVGTWMLGFHLAFPARWRDDLLLLSWLL